jgi:hypothetical protein
MNNSEKYVISEGVFDWLMKTLIGKDNATKVKYYAAIKSDRKLYKLSKELEQTASQMQKTMQKSHNSDSGFDINVLKRLQRGL